MILLEELATAVRSIVEAAERAQSSLATHGVVSEDMPLIVTQAAGASVSVEKLRALAQRDDIHTALDKLNNQLAGALSLAMLCREDLAPAHPSRADLERVEDGAKRAADIVRRVARTLE